ncbi:MAG: HAMP domain-containing histidine kinase [Pirellulales bacterium]|nr:HAMP domain-containing histidine kinase [Pirellulales bacterium]
MLSKWPIRVKLLVGLGLLILVVAILSGSGLMATYAYRDLVESLSGRVSELPLAAELSQHVTDLRITVSRIQGIRATAFSDVRQETDTQVRFWRDQFRLDFLKVEETLARYRQQLTSEPKPDQRMADFKSEWETVRKIKMELESIRSIDRDESWMLNDLSVGALDTELEGLQNLTKELPSHLHNKLKNFSAEVRGQYRTLIIGTWLTTAMAVLLFGVFVHLFYRWIFRPLRILISGSRRVASGDFDYRIGLPTNDEMAELAAAMNDMTSRFQDIRDDLDRQVQERTKQVVRAEQMASVGFLAAGVAHEINNPLASIAMCAESLEGRIGEALQAGDPQHAVIAQYLQLIQSEAFRCKEITEKLLDFSRIGPVTRQETDLGELVQGVIEVVRHIGKYQDKQIEFSGGVPVPSAVNAQEIKQVVLNLLTNALDSLGENGRVRVKVTARGNMAEITVVDNGCGMEPEVLRHIFEPFFTRRRGGQGTGLGLSICYRIVSDHGGTIDGFSEGAGKGAAFRVRLPLVQTQKQAA